MFYNQPSGMRRMLSLCLNLLLLFRLIDHQKNIFWFAVKKRYYGEFCLHGLSLSSSRVFLQLLSSMTECLCVDVQSLGVWRQLYTKHLPQSRCVMWLFVLVLVVKSRNRKHRGSGKRACPKCIFLQVKGNCV